MTNNIDVDEIIKSFPSEDSIGRKISGQIERGGNFWGTLEGFDASFFYIRGARDQEIVVKRKAVACLVVD